MKLIATSNTIELVNEDDIIYIEAYQNYSKFYMKGNKLILSRDSLGSIEKNVGNQFYRIHHSFIINLTNISRYFRTGEIEMNNKKSLPVARRRRTDFIRSLEELITHSTTVNI